MPLFWKPYQSDVSAFLEGLKAANPDLENQQRIGRSLLWDKPQDRNAQVEYRKARVAQQAYVYQNRPR